MLGERHNSRSHSWAAEDSTATALEERRKEEGKHDAFVYSLPGQEEWLLVHTYTLVLVDRIERTTSRTSLLMALGEAFPPDRP